MAKNHLQPLIMSQNRICPTAQLCSAEQLLPLRTRFRAEMNCQIVHDSIHRRQGWTMSYLLELNGTATGFGSVAIAGPWKDKPTLFEFYLLPEHRARAFDFFEVLLATSGARFFEIQTNEQLTTALALTYAGDIATEKIVFQDHLTTALTVDGAMVRAMTAEEEVRDCIDRRQGGGEWVLEFNGTAAGKGGILFHYNLPYGDIYMEINEPFRRRGFGSYLVQELKRECYRLGAIPCARCSPNNLASRKTLQRAGFVPVAHILIGPIGSP
jgi:GNAT superfamily N-acetyltransferase